MQDEKRARKYEKKKPKAHRELVHKVREESQVDEEGARWAQGR